MNGRLVSLYKSLDVPDLLLDSLKAGKNISVVANPGLHRTFTYLKSILRSIQPDPSPPSPTSFYEKRIFSSPAVQKYVFFSSDKHTSLFLYSFCRLISQDHIFHRFTPKFMTIAHSVFTGNEESSPEFQYPKSDIFFTNQTSFKNLNPTYLVFDSTSQNYRNNIIRHFPQSKVLNISSSALKLEIELKFNFKAPHKTYSLSHHSRDQILQILTQSSMKIIVFPSERKQKEFAHQYRSHLFLVFYNSSKIWYPVVFSNRKIVVLSTVQEIDEIVFPFERWVFFDMDLKTYQKYARSDSENIFLSN